MLENLGQEINLEEILGTFEQSTTLVKIQLVLELPGSINLSDLPTRGSYPRICDREEKSQSQDHHAIQARIGKNLVVDPLALDHLRYQITSEVHKQKENLDSNPDVTRARFHAKIRQSSTLLQFFKDNAIKICKQTNPDGNLHHQVPLMVARNSESSKKLQLPLTVDYIDEETSKKITYHLSASISASNKELWTQIYIHEELLHEEHEENPEADLPCQQLGLLDQISPKIEGKPRVLITKIEKLGMVSRAVITESYIEDQTLVAVYVSTKSEEVVKRPIESESDGDKIGS